MKLQYHIFLLTFLFSFSLLATETVIKGKIENFDGKTIQLGFYKDFITFEKEWTEKVKIVDGAFTLNTDLSLTRQSLLRIEDKETSLFLDPGKVYNIKLNYDGEANRGRAFDKFLSLSFPFPEAGETNLLIKTFNTAFQNFFDLNYQKMMYKGANKETNEFIAKWEKDIENESNVFVANYIRYTLAYLKDINNTPKAKLYSDYLKDKSILYQQKEYFNFFTQFYKNDFQQLTLKKEGEALTTAIMMGGDAKKVVDAVMKAKSISNPALAELYLMNGLFEVYHQKTINQKKSIQLLQKLEKSAFTYPNQTIAGNILKTLLRFEKKQNFADFSLKDEEGNLKSLANFKGKPTYINFWSNTSIPSLRELKVIKVLNEKYGDAINFVSINLDEDMNTISNTKSRYGYDWTFLHYGNDYELKERYDIRTIPTYFLIDGDGKLIQAHAPGPTEIEKTLYNLSKRP